MGANADVHTCKLSNDVCHIPTKDVLAYHACHLPVLFVAARTEMTCSDIDGATTAATCGANANCDEGGANDGYVCQCDAGHWGSSVSNSAATCTGKV